MARFQQLKNDSLRLPVILHQAAFSILAAAEDTMGREGDVRSQRYMDRLLDEQKAFSELLKATDAEFKLIVWPVRVRNLTLRLKHLLDWMRRMKDNPRVSFVCAEYRGSNRYIVPGQFCAEGFKLHDTSGYEMTVVKYLPDKINETVQEFDMVFDRTFQDNESTIRRIEEMCSKVPELG